MQCNTIWATTLVGVALCTTLACGTLLPTSSSNEDEPNPSAAAQPNGDPGGTDGGLMMGEHSYSDGGPLFRRCSADAPFTSLTEIRRGSGVASFARASSLNISAQGTGILAFANGDDLGILASVRLVGDELIAVPGRELDALQSMNEEAMAALTTDARVVAIDRRTPDGSRQSWVARRDNASAPFNPPIPILGYSLNGTISEAVLTATGARMYFTLVEPPPSNAEDIYVGDLDVLTGILSRATKLSVSTPQIDGAPIVSVDELEIFYVTDASSGDQTFHATRKSLSDGFGPSAPLTIPGHDPANDTSFPTWLSPDACDLYILGNRGGVFSLRRLHRSPVSH